MIDPHTLWPNVIEGGIITVGIIAGFWVHGLLLLKAAKRISQCQSTCSCSTK